MNDRQDGFDRPTIEQWRAGCPDLVQAGKELVGPCPACGGTDRFHVRQDGVFGCRGCNDFKAIMEAAGFEGHGNRASRPEKRRLRPSKRRTPPPPAPDTPESGLVQPGPDTGEYAAKLWAAAAPVPGDPQHPARKWADRRGLWDPARAWPWSLRWIEAAAMIDGRPAFPHGHTGAGSLAAAVLQLGTWRGLLDDEPPADVDALQLLALDPDGRPAKDRADPEDPKALEKRTLGQIRGRCAWIPTAGGLADTLHVVEGLADALAVSDRDRLPACAVLGTSGFRTLADAGGWDGLAHVLLWSDGDAPGRKAAQDAARRLKINHPRIRVTWRELPDGQDPASFANFARS